MKNIVLIGMPGCGKSTLGRLLAQHLKRPFYDADNVLEKLEGKTIKEPVSYTHLTLPTTSRV